VTRRRSERATAAGRSARRTERATAARRAQGEESRARLLRAATALIAERGYAASSVGEVCRRAGVAKPALYWHFGSKEGLLAQVIESAGTAWIERIRKSVYLEGDPIQRFERLLAGWRRIQLEEPGLLRLLMVVLLEQGEASHSARGALLRVVERARAALVQGMEDSLGPLPDLDLVADTLLCLLQGAVLRRILEPAADLERHFGEIRRTIALVLADRLPPELRTPRA
jgi:AcrR family transcriptional regulator